MNYRPEIDGLRAIAVLPVILFHAGFLTFSGGFVGVDVFFVISGYLITSLIRVDQQAGTFSLAEFYERRARRILPALYVVMLACLPFAAWLLLPHDLKRFSQSLVAVATFSSNILFYLTSGYFETANELKPLLHTWSALQNSSDAARRKIKRESQRLNSPERIRAQDRSQPSQE